MCIIVVHRASLNFTDKYRFVCTMLDRINYYFYATFYNYMTGKPKGRKKI